MGSSPSKVPHSPIKSKIHSPWFDKKAVFHNGTVTPRQDNRAASKEHSSSSERQTTYPKERLNLPAQQGRKRCIRPPMCSLL